MVEFWDVGLIITDTNWGILTLTVANSLYFLVVITAVSLQFVPHGRASVME